MADIGVLVRLRRALRRRERVIVMLLLASTLGMGSVLALEPLRAPALNLVERALMLRETRWTEQLERAERWIEQGRFGDAADLLERLDSVFPARHIKHARGHERERVIAALGRAYAELGRKRRTLETLRRGVEFDPRNFENHLRLGRAAARFGEPEQALASYRRVLAIDPLHLETLEAVIGLLAARGDFANVVEAYESYLTAFWLERVEIELGNQSASVSVPVDGVFHDVEARFPVPVTIAAEFALRSGRLASEVEDVVLRPALRIGEPGAPPVEVTLPTQAANDLRIRVPRDALPVASARLRLRLLKPASARLWHEVERAYRNQLAWDELAAARTRTRVVGAEPAS